MRTSKSSSLSDTGNLGVNGIGAFPSVCRKESGKILGDCSGINLGTLAMVTKRLYMFPFQTPKQLKINKLRVGVSTSGSNSACSVGIFNNTKLANNNDNPFNRLAFVDTLITTSTGDKESNLDFTFNKDLLYWIAVICTGAPTLRALTPTSIFPSLGRVPNSVSSYTHLYKNLTNSLLPSVAPTDLILSTGNIPAVYILE